MGRSVETIRYTLKQFDQEHPEAAVFPEATGPLDGATKKKIYQQYRRGVSVESLAKTHCRTRTSIYRVINEMRAARIMELPLDYHPQSDCSAGPTPSRRSWGLPPRDRRRRRSRACPAGCRPTWPACTRCRC